MSTQPVGQRLSVHPSLHPSGKKGEAILLRKAAATLAATAVASLTGLGLANPAQAQTQGQTVNIEQAINVCTKTIAESAPFTAAQARTYCDCSFRTLSQKYSAEEVSRIARQVQQGGNSQIPPEWIEVAQGCLQRAIGGQ